MRLAKVGSNSLECIDRRLYKRQHLMLNGEWSTLYYGKFKDWKKKRRTFPLGDDLESARDRLGELRRLNRGRYDFDQEKAEREKAKTKAMTLGTWLDSYLELVQHTPSWSTKKAQCAHLKRLMGSLPLIEAIRKVRIMEYKKRRLSEPIIRHGEPVKDTKVMGSTVNREVSCLITALNLWAEDHKDLCDGTPRIRKEKEIYRERTLANEEYKDLLNAPPPDGSIGSWLLLTRLRWTGAY